MVQETFSLFGMTFQYYDLFFVIGFIGVFSYLLAVSKKYDIATWKTVVFTVLVYGASFGWMFVLYWLDTGYFGGNNIVRVFWWLGVFVFPVSLLLKEDYFKCLDFVAPCLCINHGLAHFGCLVKGCCHGYACSFGNYSNIAGTVCFPTQIIEAVVALGIAFYIWLRERRKGYGKGIDGLSFPIMLMIFGYSRFFLEFFRAPLPGNEVLFYISKANFLFDAPTLYISQLQVHALLNGIIGTVAYFLIKKYFKSKKAAAK